MTRRIIGSGMVAVTAIALTMSALAQNASSEFVVAGPTAEKIKDYGTINLATAEKIALACEKEATNENERISVQILDNDGNQVYMDRMDGQGYLNIITSDMKARTALGRREPSKMLMNRVIQNPEMELQQIQLGFFANSGGLPIIVNKQMIGAVGVGGSNPRVPAWSDEICAHRALVSVLGSSVPPLTEDIPPPKPAHPGKVPVPKFEATAVPKSTLPPEFVISGKAAGIVYDANQISLAAAKKIGKACRDWAASHNATMSLYVIDTAGEFVHMERMDGQVYANIKMALMKAQTALRTRQPTSIRGAQLQNDPAGIPKAMALYNFFTLAGGIPIVVDGQMIGAVGVGGAAVGPSGGGGDEACAAEGLKAAFGAHVALPVYAAAP